MNRVRPGAASRGRRHALACILLPLSLLLACSRPEPARPRPDTTASATVGGIRAITIEHTPCFGACPIFSYRFDRTGSVTYTAGRFVTDSATRSVPLAPAVFDSLALLLERAHFLAMDSLYAVTMTDQSSVILTAALADTLKVVVRYGRPESAPAELQGIIDSLDAAGARLFGHHPGNP